MAQRELLKLVGVDVDGLFGIYDHQIDLNVDDRVTILHGPNGVGKTTVLKLIDALMGNRLEYFEAVPFSLFRLRFGDGGLLEAKPSRVSDALDVSLERRGKTRESATVGVSTTPGARYLSFVRSWPDEPDPRVGNQPIQPSPAREGPAWLAEFLAQGSVHLIDAHRLERRGRPDVHVSPPLLNLLGEPGRAGESRILECAKDLQARLNGAMAEYGRESQALDQAFPVQLLAAANEPALTNQELAHRLAEVDEVTEELISLGILNGPVGHELAKKGIVDYEGEAVAQVMTLYVKNAEQKLDVLRDLANRVRTLLGGVNSKFKHKRLRLDREKGLVVEGDAGPLALDSLSSGEQREIALHYNLLFMTQPNTVVLIDEPETSLHVAWQKAFLRDLLATAELSGFDALVATHSPYVAAERTDLMVALGDAT